MNPDMIRWKYIDNIATLYSISCDIDSEVRVIGDPENAAYEWIVLHHGQVEQHSNDAYGSPETALRDGLNAMYPHSTREQK